MKTATQSNKTFMDEKLKFSQDLIEEFSSEESYEENREVIHVTKTKKKVKSKHVEVQSKRKHLQSYF